MAHLKKYWWIYLLIIIAIISYMNRDKIKNMFASLGNSESQRTYDTGKCCESHNPCGWSRSLYDKQCSSSYL